MDSDGLVFGAGMTLSEVKDALAANSSKSPESFTAISETMKHVAHTHVRNVGTWAGNVMMHKNKGFPSDLVTLFGAAGAVVTFADMSKGVQDEVPLLDFVDSDYSLVAVGEPLLLFMKVPFLKPNEHFVNFRNPIRPVNSHALINSAFRVTLTQAPSGPSPVLSDP